MLWFYERDHVSLRVETRYDNDTAEYVGILHHPDGRQETQRFDKRDAGLAARDIVDRPHRSSVPGRETCASPRSQALEGDRSTVTDASTRSVRAYAGPKVRHHCRIVS